MSKPYSKMILGICAMGAAALALGCTSGCVSQLGAAPWPVLPATAGDVSAFKTATQAVREAFPPAYRATQRAIITVRGRQFVCDGLLTVSPGEGWHLALISTLGLVADLAVKGDGSGKVLKVTPLFREAWARQYVTQELRWLFVPPAELKPAGRQPGGRLVLETRSHLDGVTARYACSADGRHWEELEVWDGPRRLFRAKLSGYRSFSGWPRAVPAEIEVDAGRHQLHLRTAALNMATRSPAEGSR